MREEDEGGCRQQITDTPPHPLTTSVAMAEQSGRRRGRPGVVAEGREGQGGGRPPAVLLPVSRSSHGDNESEEER